MEGRRTGGRGRGHRHWEGKNLGEGRGGREGG